MRARLTVRFVAVTALALLVAGLASLLLAARQGRAAAERELARQAAAVARQADAGGARATLGAVRQVLRLQDAEVVTVDRGGRLVGGALPPGVDAADLTGLAAGQVASGTSRGRVWAAAAIELPGRGPGARRPPPPAPPLALVVMTRPANPGLGPALGYFALAGGLALVVAAVVGDQLGRRLSAPLAATEEASRQVAAGDLAARVALAGGEPPELRRLAESVNAMAASLERAKRLERQFLLSVSHDLRTPMTSIRGFAEAIADGTAPDPPRAAAVVASEAKRLERLVGDLLQLATLDARAFALHPRPTDLREVVADTAAGFEPAARAHGLAITGAEPGPGAVPVVVRADPDRLAQVVANLVENALKHAATTVRVEVGADGCVAVEDDGPGISDEDLPHVFDRLYQSPTRRSGRQVGSGLGLAIVAELVDAMGGRARADRLPAGGTRVAVCLPLSPPAAAPGT